MKLIALKSDKRTLEAAVWSAWLGEAKLVERFNEELGQDAPFSYNETASVSLLTAAAAKAG